MGEFRAANERRDLREDGCTFVDKWAVAGQPRQHEKAGTTSQPRQRDLTRGPSNQSRTNNIARRERGDRRFVSILTGFKSCTLFEAVCRSTLTRTRARAVQ